MHPLAVVLEAAAAGRFPAADGEVEVFAPADVGAVVALTGHAYVLADVDADELTRRGGDAYGGVYGPEVLRWIAGPDAELGTLDVVLVRRGTGRGVPAVRADLEDHPRVARARHHRRDVEVYGDEHGLVLVGRGLVDRVELAVELFEPGRPSAGRGRALIELGLGAVPTDVWCWAQVAAGNAASLRAFLAAGFVPIGSEVLIERPVP